MSTKKSNKQPVATAMSGGVDSLTTALLLKEQGVDIWGIHMIVGVPPEQERHPDSFSFELEKTRELLKKIEQSLEIEIKIVDLRDDFFKLIIKPFVNLYLQG
ncbi:MAG TPA: tRNA 2-thiouridine(34) synthase MnmA, partial [Deltaproteobacteria bacterium]|nr:tRNA 2-thiouridine(34) synthase MnmA [Deltaproteobacteria bacterium]